MSHLRMQTYIVKTYVRKNMCMRASVHAKSLQSCPTLCDPMDCSPPGSSVHGILQARTLEWVAMTSSRGSSWPRDWTQVSCIGRQFLYHERHLESPRKNIGHDKCQILDCERAEEPDRAGGTWRSKSLVLFHFSSCIVQSTRRNVFKPSLYVLNSSQ